MNSDHCAPKSQLTDAPHHQKGNDVRNHHLRQGGQRTDAAHARCAAGRFKIEKEDADDFAESERQNHHIDSSDPERRRADESPGCRRRTAASTKRDNKGNARLGQNGTNISANRHEPALPQ